jgi:hypothetical protein
MPLQAIIAAGDFDVTPPRRSRGTRDETIGFEGVLLPLRRRDTEEIAESALGWRRERLRERRGAQRKQRHREGTQRWVWKEQRYSLGNEQT